MTILGLNLAMGDMSWAYCLWAISSWNSAYSSSLSWTCLSLRNDQPLMCLSKSTSAYGAAPEPSPAVSLLDLLAGSFCGAISSEDTFVKLVCMKYQLSQQKPIKLKWCTLLSTKRKCRCIIRKCSHTDEWVTLHIYLYTCICTYFSERHFMTHIHTYIRTFHATHFFFKRNFLCCLSDIHTYFARHFLCYIFTS